MRKNKTLTFVLLSAMVLSANAFVIDWNKIVHWAGSGNNKAAMVVQFDIQFQISLSLILTARNPTAA